MSDRGTFINAAEKDTFARKGFRNGVRVVSLLGGPAGVVVDASSPDLVIHWENTDSGVFSETHYLNCKLLSC